MDTDTILRQGEESLALLQHPAFVRVASTYINNLSAALFATDPHEVKKREQIYYLYRAATDIIAGLQQEAQVALQIMESPDTDGQE